MKKLLAVLAMAAVCAGYARAEDKGTEFKFGGEVRERFQSDQDVNATSTVSTNDTQWLQRNQFHVNAISGDSLQGYFNFLNYYAWGGATAFPINNGQYATTSQATGGAVNTNQAVQVNEAWLWWKVSDQFSLKSGRLSATFGDGTVLARNDWLANPYAWDALMGRFSWDFLDLNVGGGKLADAGIVGVGSPATGISTDTEIDWYGLYAGFKNLPEFLKVAEVWVLQVNGDTGATGSTFIPAAVATSQWNLTNYGLHVKGEASIVDYRLDANFQSGKQKGVAGASDITLGGSMFDVEVGANFPEFMKGRVYLGYHMDSGDDGTSTTANNTYQPLFYDIHKYGSGQDIIGWGNLTDFSLGFTLSPTEDTTVAFEGSLLSRTKTASAVGANNSTGNAKPTILTANQGNPYALSTSTATDSSLGTEITLKATHNYGHGFSILGQMGFFSLGSYFKPAGTTVASGSPMQFLAQAQYNF